MTKEAIIQKTIEILEKLPSEKINEVSDFADFILKKYEEQLIQKGMEKIVSESEAFSFLQEEEDLYEEKDLKEKY
ncbi:MAG: hypothetical protein NXH89_02260 [Cyclobacteriaceae bacterium]|jgi:hypothetical protein|uniref:DUF2281 domain-containing protein n=1 Tax=Algoriphagus marincola TaxID=264027 RepID=A0ABS7NC97_9BACT|nr:hypothetical protein [Algoriphagus marincola]MBY5952805.1 hypothetical protein [Algoriphagus marincola]MCR9081214.1 hypothetical protein [Cyclobacteriaceae bacterium]